MTFRKQLDGTSFLYIASMQAYVGPNRRVHSSSSAMMKRALRKGSFIADLCVSGFPNMSMLNIASAGPSAYLSAEMVVASRFRTMPRARLRRACDLDWAGSCAVGCTGRAERSTGHRASSCDLSSSRW